MTPDFEQLRQALAAQKPGALTTDLQQRVIQTLGLIWDDLPGATETKMCSRKLERGCQWTWSPPVLSFSILRHPTAAAGGTRDEKQQWSVNVRDSSVKS